MAPPVYDHVIWIWMENHFYGQVIGNKAAPYTNALVHRCGTSTNYRSTGSPSLPNYIAATSGGTQGIRDDAGPAVHPLNTDNVFRQVRSSGRTERSYEESMPAACTLAGSGRYAVKHNPAAYYVGGSDRQACMADDVPMGAGAGSLATDVANSSLPTLAFITPNLCDDTHDCSVAMGDAWLSVWLERILQSSTYRAGRTAVFVVWDEDAPMPNVIIGPATVPGTVSSVALDHYSLLRTTEEMLAISALLGRAAGATSMRALFNL